MHKLCQAKDFGGMAQSCKKGERHLHGFEGKPIFQG